MKRKKRPIGTVVEIIMFAVFISVIGLILNLLGVSGYKTRCKL